MTIAVSSGQVSDLERMGGIWQGRSFGNAVGPRWSASLPSGAAQRSIILENDCEVKRLVCHSEAPPWKHRAGRWCSFIAACDGDTCEAPS